MKLNPSEVISKRLGKKSWQVSAVLKLFKEGATIPFISRYRKEATGSLDEVEIENIQTELKAFTQLESRREFILKTIQDLGKMNPQLLRLIEESKTLTELEDLYLPFKVKRKSRGVMAQNLGLNPLAEIILNQKGAVPEQEARKLISHLKEKLTVEEALQGARDILAERINEHKKTRAHLRNLTNKMGGLHCSVKRGKKESGEKFKDYFQMTEKVSSIPAHRILAALRGEKEGILKVSVEVEEELWFKSLRNQWITGRSPSFNQLQLVIKDSYKRLIQPSLENEVKKRLKEKADLESVKVFAGNLRQLLMEAPLGQKCVMAIDPGFRTGCKVVVLDKQGNFLKFETIYPHPPQNKKNEATQIICGLLNKYNVEAIGIGNGTAGKETMNFVNSIKGINPTVIMVNENGASVYSASPVARKEFPKLDVTVRGAISIGRRLLDPLSELVKIDPKSIGIGQYQHDIDQKLLQESLESVVVSCVNKVGVQLNSSSASLLQFVSGLGPGLADNIIKYRKDNGPFKSRSELKKVPRLGPKAFEQAAGFLRIKNAKSSLDESGVHPERYPLVNKMAKDYKCSIKDLLEKEELREQINLNGYISGNVGLPTLKDIMKELGAPGRDPREKFELFSFAEGINKIEDLYEGMVIPGIITNITNFGAFVDIGVHQDGLVHLSQLADVFVKDPTDHVKMGQKVSVKVTSIEVDRKRISLSMKGLNK